MGRAFRSSPKSDSRRLGFQRFWRVAATFSAAMLAAVGALSSSVAPAQTVKKSYAQLVREANDKTITIVAGAPGETSLDIAQDLAVVLHCVDGLRVVPIVGRGDANNVYDLLFLRGVDMAIVRADILDHVAKANSYVTDLKDRVRYVAPLFEQEVHLIASDKIKSIKDLEGKLVNVGATGTLALEATRILEAAGVKVVASKFDHKLALERVVDGSLDAMFITGGKPMPILKQLDSVTGLRLLPIPALKDSVYSTATLTHDDYPTLVPADGPPVSTISVPSVLAVYNWPDDSPRFAKNKIFTDAMFRRIAYLRRPARHAKWATSAFSTDVVGWERFSPAKKLVDEIKKLSAGAPAPKAKTSKPGLTEDELNAMFEARLKEFGLSPRSDAERALLFDAFKRTVSAASE
ncbi:MAG: hypothetical protein MRY74_08765 [Neomegalonema sp.]|nr:hypothetical protein [Neomegalonema sp.]